MEIDVRDQAPGGVTAIRFADNLTLNGTAQNPIMEILVDGQPPGSGMQITKTSTDALIRALNASKKVW